MRGGAEIIMKKIYTIILGGCLAVNGALADNNALNSKLNPKAVRKAVSSFTTAMASKGAMVAPGLKSFEQCVSKYVAKDGTYNTNITVKQFSVCCMKNMHSPDACIKLIEDVVYQHNTVAGYFSQVLQPCIPQDLKSLSFATAGKYVLVNGVKRCAATACASNAYLVRYTEGKRYGESKGYCAAGENPWICTTPDGKCTLKQTTQNTNASESDVVQSETQNAQNNVDAGDATHVNQTVTQTSDQSNQQTLKDAKAAISAAVETQSGGQNNLTNDNPEMLRANITGINVQAVDAKNVQIQAQIPQPTREEALAAAKNVVEKNAAEIAADAIKGSEKTKAKIDALEQQEQLIRAYIDTEDNYNLDDLDASIAYAEKVRSQQRELQKVQKQEENLTKKLKKQEKAEEECAAKHGTYKAGSCWCGALILTGNMDCAEIEANKQARKEKNEANKATRALEQEKANLQTEIGNMQKKIADLTKSAKSTNESNAKKLEQKKKELQDLNNKIDEARRMSDKMHESGDVKLADKLKELKSLEEKRPGLQQQVADLEAAQSVSYEDQISDMLEQIKQKQQRIADIDKELSGK